GFYSTALQKFGEQQADADDFALFESARNFRERNVTRDEGDGEFSAGQTHREAFHATALGKKFCLPGKLESRFVHTRFVNWTGHDRVQLAASRTCDRFL